MKDARVFLTVGPIQLSNKLNICLGEKMRSHMDTDYGVLGKGSAGNSTYYQSMRMQVEVHSTHRKIQA